MAQPRFGSSTFGQSGAPKGPDYGPTSSSPAPPNPLELGSARGITEHAEPDGTAKTCICPAWHEGISENDLRAQGFIPATSGNYKGNPEPERRLPIRARPTLLSLPTEGRIDKETAKRIYQGHVERSETTHWL